MLTETALRLAEAGRDEAPLKAELLLAHVLGLSRLDALARSSGYGQPLLELTALQEGQLAALAARVAAGEPLQYVLGEAWFWGRSFKVDRRALIPRPETEELVEHVLGSDDLWQREYPLVADVGTGTGCIALTLAAERPLVRVIAADVSAEVLALARENAARLGLVGRVDWRLGDLLDGIPAGSLDAVVSNPPYIAAAVVETLAEEVRSHEPRLALDGGADGLAVVRRLVAQAALALRGGGRVWMEIGDEQGSAVKQILTASGFAAVQIRRDLAGQDRIAEGQRV